MKAMMFAATVLLAPALIVPSAMAQQVFRETVVTRVVNPNLNRYVGQTLFGYGNARLGVVDTANSHAGVIGVSGRHGEFALISSTLLADDGAILHAPLLTQDDIKAASDAQLANPNSVLTAPHIIIVEPSAG